MYDYTIVNFGRKKEKNTWSGEEATLPPLPPLRAEPALFGGERGVSSAPEFFKNLLFLKKPKYRQRHGWRLDAADAEVGDSTGVRGVGTIHHLFLEKKCAVFHTGTVCSAVPVKNLKVGRRMTSGSGACGLSPLVGGISPKNHLFIAV